MSSVTDELATLVAMPTQQAGGDSGAGDERALCEYLAAKLQSREPDEVIVNHSARGRQSGRFRVRTVGNATTHH